MALFSCISNIRARINITIYKSHNDITSSFLLFQLSSPLIPSSHWSDSNTGFIELWLRSARGFTNMAAEGEWKHWKLLLKCADRLSLRARFLPYVCTTIYKMVGMVYPPLFVSCVTRVPSVDRLFTCVPDQKASQLANNTLEAVVQ